MSVSGQVSFPWGHRGPSSGKQSKPAEQGLGSSVQVSPHPLASWNVPTSGHVLESPTAPLSVSSLPSGPVLMAAVLSPLCFPPGCSPERGGCAWL